MYSEAIYLKQKEEFITAEFAGKEFLSSEEYSVDSEYDTFTEINEFLEVSLGEYRGYDKEKRDRFDYRKLLGTAQKLANLPGLFLPLLFKTTAVIIAILIGAVVLLLPVRRYSAALSDAGADYARVVLTSEDGSDISYELYVSNGDIALVSGSCASGEELLFTQLDEHTVYRVVMGGEGDGDFYFNTLHGEYTHGSQPGDTDDTDSTSEIPGVGTDTGDNSAPDEDTTNANVTTNPDGTSEPGETTGGETYYPVNMPSSAAIEVGQADDGTPPEAYIYVDWTRDDSDLGYVYVDYAVYPGLSTTGNALKEGSLKADATELRAVLNGLTRGKYTLVCTLSYVVGNTKTPLDVEQTSSAFLCDCFTAVNAPTDFKVSMKTGQTDFAFTMSCSFTADDNDCGDLIGTWEIVRVSDGTAVKSGEQAYSNFGTAVNVGKIDGAQYNIVCKLVFRNAEGHEHIYDTATISGQTLYTTSPVNAPITGTPTLETNKNKNLSFVTSDGWKKTAEDGDAEIYYAWTLYYKATGGDTKTASGNTTLGNGGLANLIEVSPVASPEQGDYYLTADIVFKSPDGYTTVLKTIRADGFLAYYPENDVVSVSVYQGQNQRQIGVFMDGGAPDKYGECYVHIDIKDSSGNIVAQLDVSYETISSDTPVVYAPQLPTGTYTLAAEVRYKVTTRAEFKVTSTENKYSIY